MKLSNEVDTIYDAIFVPHHETIGGGYRCPVCKKDYVNLDTFSTHLERRDCFDLKAVLKGTMLESTTFEWYKEVIEAHRGRSIFNIAEFRKDRLYRQFVYSMIFCIENDEDRIMKYLAYIMLVKKYKSLNGALSNMRKESNLRDYRMWLHVENEIDDEVFVTQYGEDLKTDQHFLVRSLEKAHVSVHTLVGWDLDAVLKDIPIDYKERIQAIAEAVGI